MTLWLTAFLVLREDAKPDGEHLKRYAYETCKKFGLTTQEFGLVSECVDWFQQMVEREIQVPSAQVFYTDVSVSRTGGVDGWYWKDATAQRLMEGTHSRWTSRLIEHLPRPMAMADYDDALRAILRDEDDPDSIREAYHRCINGYRQTSLCGCLDALWSNPMFRKDKGMIILSEGAVAMKYYEVGYEDMLKDVWMQLCFFVEEEDTGYLLREEQQNRA